MLFHHSPLSTGTLSHISSLVLGFLINNGKTVKPALPPSRVLSGINMRMNGAGLSKTKNRLLRYPSLGKLPAHSTHLRNTWVKYSSPRLSAGMCSKTASGCLKLHSTKAYIYYVFFFLYVHTFPLKQSTLQLLFGTSKSPASPPSCLRAITKENKDCLNTNTVIPRQSIW